MQQDSHEFDDTSEDALFEAPEVAQPYAQPYSDATRPKDKERGATLMFALAILALLVLFSTVFARLMSIERRASAYYRDRVRSKLAARAGIERAIVELRAVAGQNHYSDPYRGGWKYFADPGPLTLPPGEPLNLLTTHYPSFRQDHPDTDVRRYGAPLAYSGYLGQPDDTSHMVYRLKIIDSGSQLNLNTPDQRTANRLLKNLLVAATDDANDGNGTGDIDLSDTQAQTIANAVIPLVNGTGTPIEQVQDRFKSKPQLGAAIIEAAVALPLNREDIENAWLLHIRDKVTVYSWEDPDVIRPYRLNAPDIPDATQARQNLAPMARAPVNLNTASAPVLFALFADLMAETRYGTFEINAATARTLATRIIARRADPNPGDPIPTDPTLGFQPFRSWPEFEAWLDDPAQDDIFPTTPIGAKLPWPGGLDWAPTGGLIERLHTDAHIGQRDLIKSQLNPNTMLNKFGALPSHGGYLRRYGKIVDKSDIVRMTTEGCFDSLGVFEITSTGLILTRDLRDATRGHMVSAGHTDLVVVRVYTPLRLTTQSQFEKHRANMVQGNFIESPEKLFKDSLASGSTTVVNYDINDAFRASVNKGDPSVPGSGYFDDSVPNTDPNHISPGWPGMVSWPQYSLKRVNTAVGGTGTLRYPMYDSANPATWDGHLTLSNMITVRTGDNDFVAGFSRGKLEAFKVRAWWEPKDLSANGAYRTATPTRPVNATELSYLANSLTRGDQAPSTTGGGGLNSVLAEQFSDVGVADDVAVRMFTEGTQLVNTGVMIGPDRFSVDAGGNKIDDRFLAYDSNNIDLRQGTSIRFWVQPLLDPTSRDKEILFYFKGSNGSETNGGAAGTPTNRAADPDFSGWPIPAGYHNNGATTETEPRHGNKQEAGFVVYKEYDAVQDEVRIKLEDLGSGVHSWARGNQIASIDVTPSYMKGAPLNKPDPAAPEWIPGSWHWIVINFGPGQIATGGRRQAFATLQVDKVTPAVHGEYIMQRGDNLAAGAGGGTELGEVHGYRDEHANVSISTFTSAIDAETVPTSASPTFYKIVPRMLGDFYHCTQYDSLSREAGTSQGGAATYGRGTVAYRRTKEYGELGGLPAIRWVGGAWPFYPFVASGGAPGSYTQVSGVWPLAPFPGLCTNRSIAIKFTNPGGAPGAPPGDMDVPFTAGGWVVPYPDVKVPFPSPFGWDNDGTNPPGAVAYPAAEPWPYPDTSREWHQSALVSWDEIHYRGRSPWAAAPWPGAGGGNWLPADLSELDMVDHPQSHTPVPDPNTDLYEHRGGRLPYAVDSSARRNKNTSMTTTDDGSTALPYLVQAPHASYIRGREPMDRPMPPPGTGFRPFGQSFVIPIDAVDDDCHGCEDCDVDGPVLFGAEPLGTSNYAGNKLAAPNPATMATAVFDNIVFINQDPDRRTDLPGISNGGDLVTGSTVSLAAKDFEDRFYEEDLAQFLDEVAGAGAKGTGAVFHRGLLELRNRRFRLSSMTWTSYKTRVTNLDFEVALWKIDNSVDGSGNPVYSYGNASLLNAVRDAPDFGDFSTTTNFAKNPEKGAIFGHPDPAVRKLNFLTNFFEPDPIADTSYSLRSPYVDGLGNASGGIAPELLILGVRLQGYTNTHVTDTTTTTADDQTTEPNPDDVGVLVSPVLETPVFEDVTLNLTFPRPQYLYAEEGAIE